MRWVGCLTFKERYRQTTTTVKRRTLEKENSTTCADHLADEKVRRKRKGVWIRSLYLSMFTITCLCSSLRLHLVIWFLFNVCVATICNKFCLFKTSVYLYTIEFSLKSSLCDCTILMVIPHFDIGYSMVLNVCIYTTNAQKTYHCTNKLGAFRYSTCYFLLKAL